MFKNTFSIMALGGIVTQLLYPFISQAFHNGNTSKVKKLFYANIGLIKCHCFSLWNYSFFIRRLDSGIMARQGYISWKDDFWFHFTSYVYLC